MAGGYLCFYVTAVKCSLTRWAASLDISIVEVIAEYIYKRRIAYTLR
jgi:hypothetical protein